MHQVHLVALVHDGRHILQSRCWYGPYIILVCHSLRNMLDNDYYEHYVHHPISTRQRIHEIEGCQRVFVVEHGYFTQEEDVRGTITIGDISDRTVSEAQATLIERGAGPEGSRWATLSFDPR